MNESTGDLESKRELEKLRAGRGIGSPGWLGGWLIGWLELDVRSGGLGCLLGCLLALRCC